ncbi:aspartyl beta-hydroxylase [Pseudomonas sp. SDI]|uniref:aspartyl/asparaginyl beta-hydroxylase domain-containing protein n=1 Tax=Pseudomonas sp. SDI TaxID=2170734 RepID=UPI000DE6920F|nr:aspartyl/asparaginyl beta-hydroxylase domain-containing protein [Pseudomonas sp. SDI]PWB31957.1 aspartyl beta-hydroxylase [Pseudomonas sp. SDI]
MESSGIEPTGYSSRPLCARLNAQVDLPPLLAALAAIEPAQWQPHFNQHYFNGDWSGVALIAPADASSELAPGTGPAVQRPAWLNDSRWQQGLGHLPLAIRSARLLRLGPGAQIHEHRDYDLGGPDADLRLHIPLLSPEQVDFMLEGQRIPMRAGECWFLDLERPHSVDNHDQLPRIHLVLDCRPTPWLLDAVAAGLATTPATGEGRRARALAEFRRWLSASPLACWELQALTDVEQFIDRTLALAAAQELLLDRQQVLAAMRQGRQRWSDQWKV